MSKITEILEYIDIADNGEVTLKDSFDWHTFDVACSDYFYLKNHPEDPEASTIDALYEKIYAKVAEKCNESGEYTIDYFNDRYTVRKISEIEQIHYDAMTDEEKSEYGLNKKKNTINNEIAEKKQYLADTDWIIPKLQECQITGAVEDLEALKEQYAEELAERKAARARINELEVELATLENSK